jgi:hypothetical protein
VIRPCAQEWQLFSSQSHLLGSPDGCDTRTRHRPNTCKSSVALERTSERNCSLKNDGQSRSTFPVWTYRGRDSTGRDYELPRSKLAEQCLQGSLCATATNSFVSLLKSLSDDALSSNDRPVC